MTAYEYLSQAYLLDQLIQSKLMQIEKLKALASCKASFVSSDHPVVKRTWNTDVMEETVMKIIEAEKELDRKIDEMVDCKLKISRTIDMVEDAACRLILEKRYLLFETWDEIRIELNYSRCTVYRIHVRALEAVQEKLSHFETF
ncbi:MAG: DUF1492 domain-containing protein [Clostridia bacterium]|nr:DUF1492 domain-containing protein [Clostridia bacterium]